MPTSNMVERKPLAARVEWENEICHWWWSVELSGVCLEVSHVRTTGRYRARCFFAWSGWKTLEGTSEESAKAEALLTVQQAVLKAAEEWRD
jgi:hypothetical protein